MTILSAELNALPLEQLVGSLAGSLVKAQGLAADETARLIDQIGFEDVEGDEPPRLRTFDFQFTRTEVDETTDEIKQSTVSVTLPLLSIINIPSIAVDEANMDLEFRIVAHGDQEERTTSSRSIAASSGAAQLIQPRRLYAIPARKNTVVNNEVVDSSASVRVSVKFKRLEQPLGVDKLMSLIDDAATETVSEG